jgi:hypothetical protein
VEQANRLQEAYGRNLAPTLESDSNVLFPYSNAGHYILNVDDSQLRVLVIVAGPPAKVCRMFARFTAAGVALAAHFLQ